MLNGVLNNTENAGSGDPANWICQKIARTY